VYVRHGPAATINEIAHDLLTSTLGTEIVISRECARCGDPTHGKPFVVGRPDVSFSISHSGELGVVVLATDGTTVGVDVEAVKPRPYLARMAERSLDPRAFTAWLDAPPAEQLELFLHAWTAKEAYLKAIGLGIATRLADIEVPQPGWASQAISVPAGYVATVAFTTNGETAG